MTRGVTITPDGERAYVGSQSSGSVSVIDTASGEVVGGPIEVGSSPLGIAIVPDQPPIASLESSTGGAGEPVPLDASASSDPDGEIARYDWSFGDGQTASDAGPTPTHIYSAPGTYRVTVTLTDSEGCSASFVFTGLTASCNGSTVARATSTVRVDPRPHVVDAPPPPPVFPSNLFFIRKVHQNQGRGITKLRVWVPGPGALLVRGRHLQRVGRQVERAGTHTLVVRLKRRVQRALSRHWRLWRLRVRTKITFRPNGGFPLTRAKGLGLVHRGRRQGPRPYR